MKNSFVLHHDTLSVINELTDEQAGQLIKEILQHSLYLNNPNKAKKPTGLNGLLKAVFHPFEMQLNRDFEKYKGVALKNAENGKKGGRPKQIKNPTKPKKADNDKESDSDKESVKENKGCRLENLPQPKKLELYSYMKQYCLDENVNQIEIEKFKDYWIATTGKNAVKKDWKATFRNWCRNNYSKKQEDNKSNGVYGGWN